MQVLGLVLLLVGGVVSVVGSIWFLFCAFNESVWWGLGCLFVPFVGLFFLFSHWDEAAKPFGISLGGYVVAIAGIVMSGQAVPPA